MEYIVTFNLHMPYTGYNDAVLTEAFYQGLADCIKDQFQYTSQEQEFTRLCQQALAFNKQYWQCKEEQGHFPTSVQYGKRPSDLSCGNLSNLMKDCNMKPANNLPSNCPTPASATTPAMTPVPAKPALTPALKPKEGRMEKSEKSAPRRPLSAEEKDHCWATRLCLYCAGQGHFSNMCPLIPTNHKSVTHTTLTFTMTAAEPLASNKLGNAPAPRGM